MASWAGRLEEFSKTIDKTFEVGSDTRVALSNKFGKVHVTTGNQSNVTIKVVIKVDARDEAKAQKMLDDIEIVFQQSSEEIMAKTEFKRGKAENKVLEVNYEVTMPASNPLKIKNKFGDVFLNSISGKFDLDLSYGNATLGALNNDHSNLDFSFSKGTLSSANQLDVELQYSELVVDRCIGINADTQFSELTVDELEKLDCDSQYDTYEIKTVKDFNMDCQFSTVNIGSVSTELRIDAQYTPIKVDRVEGSFQDINIDTQFGDIHLNFASGFKMNVDMSYGDVSYPKNGDVKKEEKSYTHHEYTGSVGSGSGNVNIDSQYGNVILKM